MIPIRSLGFSEGCFNQLPQSILSEIENVIDNVFSDNTAFFTTTKNSSYPKANLIELKDKYIIELAVAGLTKADIDIEVNEDNLIISGAKAPKYEDAKYHIKELSSRSFKKVISLPAIVDKDKITAKFEDGILEIAIPKKTDKELKDKVKKIKIN